MIRSLAEQANSLAGYFPSGRAFGATRIAGSVTRGVLEGLAQEFIRVTDHIEEFKNDAIPDETVLLLSEWESAVGIPDDCFMGTGTVDERRRDVLLKLASLGVQTVSDFLALANTLGVGVTIKGGSVHGAFPFVFPIILFPSGAAARHTLVVDLVLPNTLQFPYTFPIQFGDPKITLLECLFKKLVPANVDVLFTNL